MGEAVLPLEPSLKSSSVVPAAGKTSLFFFFLQGNVDICWGDHHNDITSVCSEEFCILFLSFLRAQQALLKLPVPK